MVRTFEQRSLIEEGQFINRDGIYMVFEGFCGIYQQKKKPLHKVDAFGKDIIDQSEMPNQPQSGDFEEFKASLDNDYNGGGP